LSALLRHRLLPPPTSFGKRHTHTFAHIAHFVVRTTRGKSNISQGSGSGGSEGRRLFIAFDHEVVLPCDDSFLGLLCFLRLLPVCWSVLRGESPATSFATSNDVSVNQFEQSSGLLNAVKGLHERLELSEPSTIDCGRRHYRFITTPWVVRSPTSVQPAPARCCNDASVLEGRAECPLYRFILDKSSTATSGNTYILAAIV
jgi:hypothetical protein